MRTSIFIMFACLFVACEKENPVEPPKPQNVRLNATYSISIIDHANVISQISIVLQTRPDIDSVEIQIWQSKPVDNLKYRFPYRPSYLIDDTQFTVDSIVVIGNPKP